MRTRSRERKRERGVGKRETREREREREADEGCVKICKRVQRPLRHRGLYELRPRHILLFLVSGTGGGENSFDAYKARLKSESAKKKEKNTATISPRSWDPALNAMIFFSPLFLFRPGWGEACTRWRRRDYDKGEGMESLFHHLTFSEWYRSSRGIKAAMTLLGCVLELLISWMIMGEVSWLCTVCLVYRLVLQDGN